MKNPIQSILTLTSVFLIAILSAGCPVGVGHPLGTPGTEKIDTKLVGIWIAKTDSADMVKLEVGKKDDYTYWVEVLESGENYMVDSKSFDAWVTKVDGKSFIYSKPTDPAADEYYVYHYAINGKELAIQDVSLLVGGVDAVTDTETFRKEVSASLKLPECLVSKVEYSKH